MARIELLAHRGWWNAPAERNTLAVLERAFKEGMGVETDIRDCCGEIVISHDPPMPGSLSLRKVLESYASAGKPGWLALNVKSDGLQNGVQSLLKEFGIDHYFLFDMSIPDAMQWIRAGMTIFSRQSDVEPQPVLYDHCAGVWADGFSTDWIGLSFLKTHLAAGKSIGVISPEIHGRDPRHLWQLLKELAGIQTGSASPALMLCTDLIPEARRYFYGEN
ncbi:MAG TPA: hypothetical protein VGN88_14130 [Phycisphaerae bacterium]|jgi:glycerophosphoryl diester phosphodiesterase